MILLLKKKCKNSICCDKIKFFLKNSLKNIFLLKKVRIFAPHYTKPNIIK